MRRIPIIALSIALAVFPLAAGSFYGTGATALLDFREGSDPVPAGGAYFETSYVYPIGSSRFSQGYGTSIECALPGWHRGSICNIMTGYSLKYSTPGMMDLSFTVGPSFSYAPDGISIGGGFLCLSNLYFDSERKYGLTMGFKGTVEGMGFHDGDMSKIVPVGSVSAHVGFAVNLPKASDLPSHSFTGKTGQ